MASTRRHGRATEGTRGRCRSQAFSRRSSRARARSPASAQRPSARRCSGRSHQANFCRVRCVVLVGSFVFIARSPHAIERPPLLVTFDRIPGVSRAFFSCSGGVLSLGDSPSSARSWGRSIVYRSCCLFLVSYSATIVRSPHATERPPFRHFRSHFRCLGCSYVIFVARRWVIRHHLMLLRGHGGKAPFVVSAAYFSSFFRDYRALSHRAPSSVVCGCSHPRRSSAFPCALRGEESPLLRRAGAAWCRVRGGARKRRAARVCRTMRAGTPQGTLRGDSACSRNPWPGPHLAPPRSRGSVRRLLSPRALLPQMRVVGVVTKQKGAFA